MNSSWGCDAAEGTQIAVDQAVSKIVEIGDLYIIYEKVSEVCKTIPIKLFQ